MEIFPILVNPSTLSSKACKEFTSGDMTIVVDFPFDMHVAFALSRLIEDCCIRSVRV